MRQQNKDKALPLWAALAAPVIGVPLMIGLLAIASPKAEAPAEQVVPAQIVEPVESQVVEPVSGDSAAQLEAMLRTG